MDIMTDTAFCDTIKTLLAALGSNDPARRLQARETIRDTLAGNRKSWNDLMAVITSKSAALKEAVAS